MLLLIQFWTRGYGALTDQFVGHASQCRPLGVTALAPAASRLRPPSQRRGWQAVWGALLRSPPSSLVSGEKEFSPKKLQAASLLISRVQNGGHYPYECYIPCCPVQPTPTKSDCRHYVAKASIRFWQSRTPDPTTPHLVTCGGPSSEGASPALRGDRPPPSVDRGDISKVDSDPGSASSASPPAGAAAVAPEPTAAFTRVWAAGWLTLWCCWFKCWLSWWRLGCPW